MVVKIFDSAHSGRMSRGQLLQFFFKDFPYKAKNFEETNFEKPPEDPELRNLFTDLGSLSLLMVKNKEENDEIRNLKAFFKDKIPFQPCNKTKFEDLDRRNFSAMFFPIETGSDPEWGMCVRSDSGDIFFFDSKDCEWRSGWSGDGDSYKLAAALAKELLESDSPERDEHIFKAAKDWIITGSVDEKGKVGKVALGSKLRLGTKKSFMIPLENLATISDEDRKRELFSVDDISTAMNLITRNGVKPLVEREFPLEVDELHILVGAALAPQVASIVLLNAKKIILWHSENSEVNADEMCEIAWKLRGILPEKRKMSSSSLLDAEKDLKKYFAYGKVSPQARIFFNFTSGNRLMAMAVQSVARLYHNVEMIYRDIDETDKKKEAEESRLMTFNLLQYSEFPPLYGKIYGTVRSGLDVNFLRNGIRKTDYKDGEDFLNKLIKL